MRKEFPVRIRLLGIRMSTLKDLTVPEKGIKQVSRQPAVGPQLTRSSLDPPLLRLLPLAPPLRLSMSPSWMMTTMTSSSSSASQVAATSAAPVSSWTQAQAWSQVLSVPSAVALSTLGRPTLSSTSTLTCASTTMRSAKSSGLACHHPRKGPRAVAARTSATVVARRSVVGARRSRVGVCWTGSSAANSNDHVPILPCIVCIPP